jgi:hypothetical protein
MYDAMDIYRQVGLTFDHSLILISKWDADTFLECLLWPKMRRGKNLIGAYAKKNQSLCNVTFLCHRRIQSLYES